MATSGGAGEPANGSFDASTAHLTGTIVLNGPVDEVFPLFSPLGEKRWVDGWDPQILAPHGAEWEKNMVFRTRSQGREDVWVVADLDRGGHRVTYFRIEPGRLVARVDVRCRAAGGARTEATVEYAYVGLSPAGNSQIAEWTGPVYRAKMERWQHTINEHLTKPR